MNRRNHTVPKAYPAGEGQAVIDSTPGYYVTANDLPVPARHIVVVWVIVEVPLVIAAIAMFGLAGWQLMTTILTFVGLSLASGLGVVAFLFLSSQWGITVAAREHHRTERRRLELEFLARLAELEAQDNRSKMQLEMAGHAANQIATMNQSNYVPSLDAPPDEAKTRILQYLSGLYDGGVTGDGRILHAVPWGTNSKVWTPADKKLAMELFALAGNSTQSWVVRYDEDRRGWYVNVERYPDGVSLCRAFAGVY